MAYSVSGFNKSFVEGFGPAYRQAADAYNTTQRDKMQEQIRQKAAQDARDRAIADSAAEAGGPVMNQDGTINAVATAAKVARYNRQQDAIRAQAKGLFDAQLGTYKRGREVGVNVPEPKLSFEGDAPMQQGVPGGGGLPQYLAKPGASGPQQALPADPMGQKTPEQMVREAEERAKLEQESASMATSSAAKALNEYRSLFGSDPTPDHMTNGAINPSGLQAIEAKKEDSEMRKARGVAVRYATLETENAGLSMDSPEGKAMFRRRLEYHTAPASAKNAMMLADLQVRAGTIPEGQYDKEVARLATFGGKVPQLSNSQEDVLLADNNAIANGADLIDAIDEFENRYGAGAFDKYTGPFDAKAKDIQWRFTGGNSPEERDARALREKWNKILNQRIYDASGKAITMQEFERLQQAWGNIESAGFRNSLANFIGQTTESFGNRLDALQSYAVPESLKMVRGKRPTEYLRYGARISGGELNAAPAPSPQAAQAPNPADEILSKYGIKP